MDSFYDAPRRPPEPIARETFPATPVVPEISVLCPTNTPRNTFTPYNQWKKDTMPNNFLVLNKENINGNFQNTQNTSILKKQVRFESPVLQQRLLGNNEPFLKNTEQNLQKNQAENKNNHKPCGKDQAIPSFEEMYMANIPNRQLDLSVIDLPKRISQNGTNPCLDGNLFTKEAQPTEKEKVKTYKEFLESQKVENQVVLNDSVRDIFNYKRNTSPKVIRDNKVGVERGTRKLNNQFGPIFGVNALQSGHNQNENSRKEFTQHGQAFQHVTEAISQRKVLTPYEHIQTQGVEQSRGLENCTPQESWFYLHNNNCSDLQSKALSENNENVDKNNPQEIKKDLKNNNFKNSNFEDVQSQHYIETMMFEDKNTTNNLVIPETQVNNGSQTVPWVSDSADNPNSYKLINYPTDSQKRHECYTQTSNVGNFENNALKVRCDDDFSVKDLLKIIAQQSKQISQQNEQLLLLQKQVSTLICQQKGSECSRQKSIQCGCKSNCCQQDKTSCDQTRHCYIQKQYCEQTQAYVPGLMTNNVENIQEKCITSTQHENYDGMKQKFEGTPKKNKNNMPNFSIGLTTSFEVSFKRPHCNKNQHDFIQKNKQLPNFDQYEPPKIQEITETDSTQSQENYQQNFQNKDYRETLVDESMVFKEPIRVREACPSPEPSIKINMNDFEESESEDDITSPEIGPSFYRNLMVQVNKILQKAQIETTEVAYNFKGQHLKHDTLHKVKEATLKHLKRIGVEVQNSEDSLQSSSSSDGTDSKSYNQDDISFAVKQLLMKYLPADHLAKAAYKEAQAGNNAMLTPKEKIGAIKNRPDFSFATVQYMRKYNLIANNQKDFCQTAKQNQAESPKILDITKLKQQPKLL